MKMWKSCKSHRWERGKWRRLVYKYDTKEYFHWLFIEISHAGIMLRSFISIAIFCGILVHGQHQTGDENCETLPFQLHLIKGEQLVSIFIQFHWKISHTHRGIRWVGSIAEDLRRRSDRQQVRRVLQQPSPAFGHHPDGLSQGMLLLPWVFPQRPSRDAHALLRPGRHPPDRLRNVVDGPAPEGASGLQVLQVRRLFTIISENIFFFPLSVLFAWWKRFWNTMNKWFNEI